MVKKLLFSLFLLSIIGACSSVKVRPLTDMTEPKEIYEEGLKLVSFQDYNRAIKYFNFIIDNYKGAENEKFVSWSIYEIGFCFYQKGDLQVAVTYFDNVLANAKTRGPRILADLVKNKITRGDGYKYSSYN